MIRRKEERSTVVHEHFKGGVGQFAVTQIAAAEELGKAGRMFGCGRLEPGHSVGWHIHEKDMEICCFLEGDGTIVDADGREYPVRPGDVQICLPGEGHAVLNTGSTPLVYIALVCYPQG